MSIANSPKSPSPPTPELMCLPTVAFLMLFAGDVVGGEQPFVDLCVLICAFIIAVVTS